MCVGGQDQGSRTREHDEKVEKKKGEGNFMLETFRYLLVDHFIYPEGENYLIRNTVLFGGGHGLYI